MKVYVHLATGFEEIEAITVVDVLRRAGITAETVSIMKEHLVTGAHDISVKADLLFEEADYDSCDMIVLPGGMPGTTNLGAHEGLGKKLREFAEKDRWLAAICAAPMVFGQAGLLQDKTAVIFPGMESHLTGARLGKRPVEIDGNIITSKGPGTAMAFAMTLVQLLSGEQTAEALKKAMILNI
jgi:4-methyl-5(b-hydroxyethyl)-thiazole monophosphate biosynthesis